MQQNMDNVVKNALDFLKQSIDDMEKDSLKYSVIHFHTAIELLLKARLINEHWSLVFADPKKINKNKFDSGAFQSISFSDAIQRVNGLSAPPEISKKAKICFDIIGKHRNKMIHFYYKKDNQIEKQIVKEQIHALYHIELLFKNEWKKIFSSYNNDILDIYKKAKESKYLKIIYDNNKKEIENKELFVFECPSCSYKTMKHEKGLEELHQATCLVCEYTARSIIIECNKCGNEVPFYNEGFATCKQCKNALDDKDVEKVLAGVSSSDKGYCPCVGMPSVILTKNHNFVCTLCLEETDTENTHTCDYCGGVYTGEYNEMTWTSGCGICEGTFRHER